MKKIKLSNVYSGKYRKTDSVYKVLKFFERSPQNFHFLNIIINKMHIIIQYSLYFLMYAPSMRVFTIDLHEKCLLKVQQN